MIKNVSKQLPWLILVFGGIVSTWAAWSINAKIDNEARGVFEMRALDMQASIASRLRSYTDILYGIAGLYSTDAYVSPIDFDTYAESLDLENRYQAVDMLNFAQYVPPSERAHFVSEFRTEIGPAVTNVLPLHPPADSDEYMVVTRTYPFGAPGIGFDLMTTSHRLAGEFPQLSSSLYRPDTPVSSGIPIRPPGKSHASLGVRLGIFTTNSSGDRRLSGTVGIVFNIQEFFKEAVPAALNSRVGFRVENIGRSDGTTYARPVPIFESMPTGRPLQVLRLDLNKIYTTSYTVPFGGALLRVDMSQDKSNLISERDKALPFLVFFSGLMFFLMASVLSRRTLDRNAALTEAIAAKTQDLHREIDRAKQLEQELARVVEEERRRIGHELHDDLGQRLTAISLSFAALSESLRPVSPELSEHAAALERDASEVIASVRGLAHGLMPVPPGSGELREALEQFAIGISSLNGVRCIFDFDDPVDVEDQNVATNLYRIAQEAVNNAIRHSHATVVLIRLDDEDGKVTLTVQDNGIGFRHDGNGAAGAVQVAGAGLRIMAYRASVINFKLTVDTIVGGGTTIKVQQC